MVSEIKKTDNDEKKIVKKQIKKMSNKLNDLKIELLRGKKRKEIKKAIARLLTTRNSKVEGTNK